MHNITDLKRATGYTVNQLRMRLELLSPILSEGFSRGPRDKILVQDSVLAILQRMYELEREGLSAKDARKRIVQELGNGDGNSRATLSEGDGRLIDHLEREIQRLHIENQRLWGLIEDLTPRLAPPKEEPQGYEFWLTRVFRHIREIIG